MLVTVSLAAKGVGTLTTSAELGSPALGAIPRAEKVIITTRKENDFDNSSFLAPTGAQEVTISVRPSVCDRFIESSVSSIL